MQPFFDAVPDGSCAAIDIDGARFADVRAGLPVIPASNQKLLVAAVALEVLGEDHRFHTELRGPQPVDGVITGDVYLVGGGDPLLVTADYVDPLPLPAFNTTSLDSIADALQAAGVTQIVGDVVGDGSRYDDEFAVPSWGPDHVLGADAGPYDALMVNDGRTFADSTIGFNPNQSAARQFIRVLQARNITVTGRSRNGVAPADGSVAVLGGVDSVPARRRRRRAAADQRQQHRRAAREGDRAGGTRRRDTCRRVAGDLEHARRVAGPARRGRARRRFGARAATIASRATRSWPCWNTWVSTASWRDRCRSPVSRARSPTSSSAVRPRDA